MTLVVAWRVVSEDDDQISIGMAADRLRTSSENRHREVEKIFTFVDGDDRTLGYISFAGLVSSGNTFIRHFAEEMRKTDKQDMGRKMFEETARRTYLSVLKDLKAVDPNTKNINNNFLIVTRIGVGIVVAGGDFLWSIDSGGVTYEAVGSADDYAIGYLDARFSDDDFDVVDSVRNLMGLVPSRFADTVGCGFDLKTCEMGLGT